MTSRHVWLGAILASVVGLMGSERLANAEPNANIAEAQPRIFYGSAVAQTGLPVALIRIDYSTVSAGCSGVVVSKDTLLTSAHCLADGPIQSIEVLVGGVENARGVRYGLSGNYIPVTDQSPSFFDIGFIKLDHPLPKTIHPVTLGGGAIKPGTPLAILGYGFDEYGNLGSLRAGAMLTSSTDGFNIYATRTPGSSNTCRGDSGGPAFERKGNKLVLVGLTSWGDLGCTLYTGFTSVLNKTVKAFIKRAKKA